MSEEIELTKYEEEFVNEVSKYICKNVHTLMCANGTCPNQWHCPVNYPVLKSLVKKGYLKNDTLKDQRIAELEEQLKNAIVPKFKVGQTVWYIYGKSIKSFTISEIEVEIRLVPLIAYQNSLVYQYEENCFATKEEAEYWLKEFKGE